MPDVDSLVTRLPRDRGYSGEPPTAGGLPGFVCPRADAYGGRDGIIAPGVAAVNGIVPKGMRHIDTKDTAKRADAARYDGRTEAERYREYYSQAEGAGEGAGRRTPPPPRPRPPDPAPPPAPSRPGRQVRAISAGREAQPVPTPVPTLQPHRVRGRILPGAGFVPPRAYRPEPDPEPEMPVLRDPDDPGMFSRRAEAPADDDTLDGFYDGLSGPAPGTGETDLPGREEALGGLRGTLRGIAAAPARPRARELPASGDAVAAMTKLAVDHAALLQRAAELEAQVADLSGQLEEARERDAHHARAEEELRRSASGETVRVALALPEERLKVGGERWECRIMGRLHPGRQGRSAVLAVSDPSYASELMVEIKPGPMVVLSGEKRTSCEYHGRCAKIYAEPDSQDFIALFWLSVGNEGADHDGEAERS